MPAAIAKYYADELSEWKRIITFYTHEMDEFEDKLQEVIQRNTIPDIASRVEGHHQKLNMISGKFYTAYTLIEQQEQALKKNEAVIDDELVHANMETDQNRIRQHMKEAEKEYVDIKYECYSFFADTIIKQSNP